MKKQFIKLCMLLVMSVTVASAGDFLMPDQAFKPYAKVNDSAQIETGVTIADEIYLYANKLTISLKGTSLSIKTMQKPKSVEHHGDKVYRNSPNFVLTLDNPKGLTGMQNVTVVLSYQGCSDMGLCYNPYTKEFPLSIDTSKLSAKKVVNKLQTSQKQSEKSETDSIADTIKSGNILLVLATFFGFGLLLAMTPCVFPMIPIISGLIISQGEGLSVKKAFALSLTYVLAMAVAYTIAGVLAGLFGANLQAALQTPWVVYGFSFIFVALAFSMFGFYELKLPDALVSKVSASNSGSGFIGVAIMGFLSALIVGPCVAAPLAGALVYIGQTGDAVLGGMALFMMSIGMGVPLIIVGVGAGKFMPKPGGWMTMVTAIFGVMMLGVAIWMLEKILDPIITTFLYSLLGIGFAIYLGALKGESHIAKKTVAVVMFIYSTTLFISVLAGNSSMIKPLGFLADKGGVVATASAEKALTFEKVTSIEELNAILEKNRGKKILLDFAADWCTSCKEFAKVTFADKAVKAKMNEFVLIRADVTLNGDKEKALSKKYGVFGPPAIIFFDKNLQVQKAKTVVGFVEPAPFLAHLNSIQ